MEHPKDLKRNVRSAGGADSEFFEVYENVYDQVHYMIKHGGLDISNLDELVKSAMEAVEAVSDLREEKLTGTRKMELAKSVIVQVIKHLGETGNMDSDLAKNIVAGINMIGPVMFKLIVMADKGQFNLGHVKETLKKATQGCCAVL